jgi:glycine/D-amino acid oxidase-like deaminating enzyme
MNEQAIPQRVDAVVIGSGALDASTAFHLASSGLSVALLDKADLASQTSPRAAGLSGQLRSNPTMTCIAAKAVQKITTFQADTGEPMVFFQPGSLKSNRLVSRALLT